MTAPFFLLLAVVIVIAGLKVVDWLFTPDIEQGVPPRPIPVLPGRLANVARAPEPAEHSGHGAASQVSLQAIVQAQGRRIAELEAAAAKGIADTRRLDLLEQRYLVRGHFLGSLDFRSERLRASDGMEPEESLRDALDRVSAKA